MTSPSPTESQNRIPRSLWSVGRSGVLLVDPLHEHEARFSMVGHRRVSRLVEGAGLADQRERPSHGSQAPAAAFCCFGLIDADL